jgi:hypothetical protein
VASILIIAFALALETQPVAVDSPQVTSLGQVPARAAQVDSPAAPPLSTVPSAVDLPLSREEQYQLLRLQIMSEMQDDVSRWAQSRFWLIALITVVVGFFGVRALVREMISTELRDATKAAATAQAAAEQARDVTKEVRAEAIDYRKTVDELKELATSVRSGLDELQTRIEAESSHAIASADLKISALSERFDELSATVQRLASDSKTATSALSDFKRRVVALGERTAEQQTDFEGNSHFRVTVVHHRETNRPSEGLGQAVIARLSAAGFRAGSGWWAKDVGPREQIEIEFAPAAQEGAERVSAIVSRAARDLGDHRTVTTSPRSSQIRDTSAIRVFL